MCEFNSKGRKVISCTTDGFLTDGNINDLDLNVDGLLFSKIFKTALSNLGLEPNILEIKKEDEEGVLS
jgi:hypothetical protein